ncbi:hypothetical protein CBR_g18761 [Chara braunii]|uniref:DDE Tnp4 domain-containing protein n=1 Tax=Chara braunii TaxID=69332 RepID=A0A388KWA9_CHABU|nr:hypothetical protein CBR_g18761 [Chara braunii]|eukprot:GBG74350.1 hypothetical protein CBR_g18761 [Chara braunii]
MMTVLFRCQQERSLGRMRAQIRTRRKMAQGAQVDGLDTVAITEVVLQPDHIVAYALYRWASGETYESGTCNFGIGRAGLVAVRDVTAALLAVYREKISWPTGVRKLVILRAFADKGFPNCHRCINCTHVYIDKATNVPSEDYYDHRKRHFSVVAQVVVNLNLRVLHVHIGYPGSCHDVRVIQLSSLWARAEAGNLFSGPPVMLPFQVQMNRYLLGDNDYPPSEWIVVPYGGIGQHPCGGALRQQPEGGERGCGKGFRKAEGDVAVVIADAQTNMETMPQQFVVVCILHNILIDAGIPFDENLLWEVDANGVRHRVDLGIHRPLRPVCMESSTEGRRQRRLHGEGETATEAKRQRRDGDGWWTAEARWRRRVDGNGKMATEARRQRTDVKIRCETSRDGGDETTVARQRGRLDGSGETPTEARRRRGLDDRGETSRSDARSQD